jgi:hypothetical protein
VGCGECGVWGVGVWGVWGVGCGSVWGVPGCEPRPRPHIPLWWHSAGAGSPEAWGVDPGVWNGGLLCVFVFSVWIGLRGVGMVCGVQGWGVIQGAQSVALP